MITNPWFLVSHPNPSASLRLFCLPHAGGGASAFYAWARAAAELPIEIVAVQLPGRENRLREPPHTDMPSLVRSMGFAIEPMLDRRSAFFGHSLGALAAFELARWLRDRGAAGPAHLFLSGAGAPRLRREALSLHTVEPEEAFVAAVSARYGGIPAVVAEERELRALIAPTLRADLAINERYEYKQALPLAVAITAYGGSRDANVTRDDLEGWREETTAGFDLRLFAGDHFFLNTARDAILADILQRAVRT